MFNSPSVALVVGVVAAAVVVCLRGWVLFARGGEVFGVDEVRGGHHGAVPERKHLLV